MCFEKLAFLSSSQNTASPSGLRDSLRVMFTLSSKVAMAESHLSVAARQASLCGSEQSLDKSLMVSRYRIPTCRKYCDMSRIFLVTLDFLGSDAG